MGKADTMAETAKRIIRNRFGRDADEIGTAGNATNNSVYYFAAAGNRYLLKLYHSRDWPEGGKIPFVYRILRQNHIPCAELIAYSRNDGMYPDGYLIERRIEGMTADRIRFGREQETMFYAGLAELVSSVHSIRVRNFGYIGSGVASHSSMTTFLEDEFDGFGGKLQDAVPETQLEKLKGTVLDAMRGYEDLPPVLCHGDLSKKNVMIGDDGEMSLIDWDDAMALNWMADVSRLTFWMKQNYSGPEYKLFRNAFLEHYRASGRKDRFDAFESAYHIYAALDFLIFAIRKGDRETATRLIKGLDKPAEA